MSVGIDLAKRLEGRPSLCAGYFESGLGLGQGYDLNELAAYLGPDGHRDLDAINRKAIFEGLAAPDLPVNYSPSTEIELQELAEIAGFPLDRLSPDFSTFSDLDVCRWIIDYQEFLSSQSNADLQRFYRNDFALGRYLQTLANGDTAWDVSLLGSDISGNSFYQVLARSVGTDDFFSFTCAFGGGNENEQQIDFVGPDPVNSGTVGIAIESAGTFQEMGDVERDTNILVVANENDPLFVALVDAIRGEKSVLISRGSAAPQAFKLKGGSAFVDTYINRCSGNKG